MMAKEALKIWLDLSADIRKKVLNNVWCPECRTAVTICDYNTDFDGGVVVLRGFCSTCGHKVARVLEGCSEKPKKPRKCALEYYIFNIWLYGDEDCSDEKRIIRKIQIPGTKSLYNFARVITKAFGFYFDHCFGFYDTLTDRKNSKKAFGIAHKKEAVIEKKYDKIAKKAGLKSLKFAYNEYCFGIDVNDVDIHSTDLREDRLLIYDMMLEGR